MIVVLFCITLVSMAVTAAWLKHSLRRQRLDIPNARSSHAVPTPTSGGTGFLAASLAGLIVMGLGGWFAPWQLLVLALGIPIAILGFLDDGLNLGIVARVVAQFIVVAGMLLAMPALPYLRIGDWVLQAPLVLAPLLLLYGVWQINFYNFMDGIDGLAAMQGLFVALSLAGFCAVAFQPALAVASLGLACALVGFVPFNLPTARLFMGDVGSNFLGYVLLALGLLACYSGAIDYWIFLILMSGFLVDATTTLMGRMSSGAVWYHGHRTHAYQLAALRLGSHARVVAVYCVINVAWLLPLAILSRQHFRSGFWITLLAWLPLVLATLWVRRRLLVLTGEPSTSSPG